MDWSAILALACSGGVLYLIVEKLFDRKKDKADATATIISNSNEVAALYRKIDEIVEAKTKPILEELEDIKSHWCCYRDGCGDRILTKHRTSEH